MAQVSLLRLLRAVYILGGAAAVLIAIVHVIMGPASIPGSVPVNATMDSEDRFYAVIFGGWGAALLWCAGDVLRRGPVARYLLGVFFLAGLARWVSWIAVGPPHSFFVAMIVLETVAPPLLWILQRRAESPGARDQRS